MDKRYGYNWNEAAIERLKALWFSGYTSSEIGRVFGVTRNSIIGKAHRLGWTGMRRKQRPKLPIAKKVAALDAGPPPEPKPKPKPVLMPRPQIPETRPNLRPPGPPAPFTLTLLELGPGMCRWPSDGDGPWTFCGQSKVEGSSYCSEHHERASNGPRPIPYFARAA